MNKVSILFFIFLIFIVAAASLIDDNNSLKALPSAYNWMSESNQMNAQYGYCVADAGDVNGDGYDDVIVGDPYYDNGNEDEGRVSLFYGSILGLSSNPVWTYEGNQDFAFMGYSVSKAGNVNNDGYSDIIIGSYNYDNGQANEGAAFVFYGSLAGLALSPDRILEANQGYANFGYAVSNAGDVNNDGYDDVIVGAPYYDNGQLDEGCAFIYLGSDTGLVNVYSNLVESDSASSMFGSAVSSAGDINNNGYDDVIVGAWQYDLGNVFVYLGNATGVVSPASIKIGSVQAGCGFGSALSEAGDVNGDGYDDFLIGAQAYDNGQTDEGLVIVINGASGGVTLGIMLEANQASSYFGTSLSSAGDVNGDGFDDILVGAPFYDMGEANEGAVMLYVGSSTGITGSIGWMGQINFANSGFGKSVSSSGDINNDGSNDIIIGANLFEAGQADEGGAFAYYNEVNTALEFDLISPKGYVTALTPDYFWSDWGYSGMDKYRLVVDNVITDSTTDTMCTQAMPLSQGVHTWFVIGVDSNMTKYSNSVDTFFCDITKPTTPASCSPPNNYFFGSHSVWFFWTESVETGSGLKQYELWIDTNTAFSTPTIILSPDTLEEATLTEGEYYWKVRAVDNAGNQSMFSETRRYVYDGTYPEDFSLIIPTGYINSQPWFYWHKSNELYLKEYTFTLNDSTYPPRTDTFAILSMYGESLLNNSTNVWDVSATDSAYNKTVCLKSCTTKLDMTPPSAATLIYPSDNGAVDTNLLIWNRAADNFSGVEYYHVEWSPDADFAELYSADVSDTFINPVLIDDMDYFYWRVTACDSAGNLSLCSDTFSFEFDTTAPIAPGLTYPLGFTEVEDSFFTLLWFGSSKNIKTQEYYIVQIDTISSFISPYFIDTVIGASLAVKMTEDDSYWWRVMSYDSFNQSAWSEIDSFILDIKIPEISMNADSHDYGDVNYLESYLWTGLKIRNTGDASLTIDSVRYTNSVFFDDTSYSFPMVILPFDSLTYRVSAESADTGAFSGSMLIYHNIYSPLTDTISLEAHFGVICVIDSAKAFDNINPVNGIDDDDFVALYFNQETDGASLNSGNINSALMLSGGHSWLDGFGEIDSIYWNTQKTILMLRFSTQISAPTIAVGDTIYPDTLTIAGALNGFLCSIPVCLTGSFNPAAGISEKMFEETFINDKTYLKLGLNTLEICAVSMKNNITVYDVAGKAVFQKNEMKTGTHIIKLSEIKSGIYFIRFTDGDKKIYRKALLLK